MYESQGIISSQRKSEFISVKASTIIHQSDELTKGDIDEEPNKTASSHGEPALPVIKNYNSVFQSSVKK